MGALRKVYMPPLTPYRLPGPPPVLPAINDNHIPAMPRLPKSPLVPGVRPFRPTTPRIPLPRTPGLGRLVPLIGPALFIAPFVPLPNFPNPHGIVVPAGYELWGPCKTMRPDIEFYRWTMTAVTSASCIAGQSVGGWPEYDNYSADAAWNITVPGLWNGYVRVGYWGMYSIGSGLYRAQHRLSLARTSAPSPALQLIRQPMPNIPMPNANRWPYAPYPAAPGAPLPGYPVPAPNLGAPDGDPGPTPLPSDPLKLDPLAPVPQGYVPEYRFETSSPGQASSLPHSRRPPPRGTKENKARSNSRSVGVWLAKALDQISEKSELVDALYDALPDDVKKRWGKDRKRKGPADQFGQYGIDGADWKLQALWHNWHRLDVNKAVKNVIKNHLEDKLIGAYKRVLPKQTGSVFSQFVPGKGEISAELGVSDALDWLFGD